MRFICAFGVVIYHFFCYLPEAFSNTAFSSYANGDTGGLFVTVFFVLSGAMLYYNYPKITSLKQFFYKRWKSIFPVFYLCYILFFLLSTALSVWRGTGIFWGGNPLKLIFTFLGIDGTLTSIGLGNYYLIGEWFLGIIILLYAIYPLLLYFFQKQSTITFFVLLSLNAYFLLTPDRLFIDAINPFICAFKFLCGFVIIKHFTWFKSMIAFLIFSCITVLLLFIKIPFLSPVLSNELAGIALFCILLFVGQPIMKQKALKPTISYLGGLTFPIFLLHHRIISYAFQFYLPGTWTTVLLFLALILVATTVAAGLVNKIMKSILKSKAFLSLEAFILK